jgi:hypothetical protein
MLTNDEQLTQIIIGAAMKLPFSSISNIPGFRSNASSTKTSYPLHPWLSVPSVVKFLQTIQPSHSPAADLGSLAYSSFLRTWSVGRLAASLGGSWLASWFRSYLRTKGSATRIRFFV